MRRLYEEYSNIDFLAQAVPELKSIEIMNKLKSPAERLFYLQTTAQNGWSRAILLNQIKSGAYQRSVSDNKTHNFTVALPEALAAQAAEMMKSRYNGRNSPKTTSFILDDKTE